MLGFVHAGQELSRHNSNFNLRQTTDVDNSAIIALYTYTVNNYNNIMQNFGWYAYTHACIM